MDEKKFSWRDVFFWSVSSYCYVESDVRYF